MRLPATKAEFAKAFNDIGKLSANFDPGITEEMISEIDGRVVLQVPFMDGTVTIDVPRSKVDELFSKFSNIFLRLAAEMLEAREAPLFDDTDGSKR